MSDSNCAAHIVGVQLNNKHVFSKTPQEFIRLIEDFGVEGDAHAGATDQHRFHVKRFGLQPNLRQVHLIQAELFDALLKMGHQLCPGELGENISTRNLDLMKLPTGTRLHLGADAVIELTGLRNPCVQIEQFQPGLLRHLVAKTPAGLIRKAGVMGVVLCSGEVRSDDLIAVELPPMPHSALIYRVPAK